MNNHYNKNLKSYSRSLRSESVSKAEKYIWKALLSRKQTGIAFKRQRPIANFIVDFFAAEIGLIIEIDGNSHVDKGEYDFYRETKLKSLGFELVRFKEGEVLNNLDKIHLEIMHVIDCLKEK
ncbi:MAG: endonuclease domain-containing protein [Flavobacteriia bacterium]|jgi:very-short-patch-repair endonuclease